MKEQEIQFNLIDEPWIKVIFPDCSEDMVSIRNLFLNAHKYEDLAGELPTQDVAVMRMLLAILHAVFYRVDEDGDENPIEDSEEAFDRWENLWKMGEFPVNPIADYLDQWYERFWLFHPERPFWQVKEAKIGTEYTASKLNGEMSESSNKVRLFPSRSGAGKSAVDYAEAARWILYVNAYDDTSAKPKGKNLPSVGTGWLGKLGLITAKGGNLFETLMLNFVLLDENEEIWDSCCPVWELDQVRSEERKEIVRPNDQAQLLTLQSRRLLLLSDGDVVTGYQLLGGDFFNRENAFSEQMTMWRSTVKNKNESPVFQPSRHDSTKKMWREFSDIVCVKANGHRPGAVNWVMLLKKRKILKNVFISYRTASVQYGDKDFFVTDVFEDALTFHLNLLTELGSAWIKLIENAIQFCDDLADCVYRLGKELNQAAGGSGSGSPEKAKERYYYEIDIPFRLWLKSLDADQDDVERDERETEWRDTAVRIAKNLGTELVEEAGPAAYLGRTVIVSKNKKQEKYHYSSAEAYNKFLYSIKKIGG